LWGEKGEWHEWRGTWNEVPERVRVRRERAMMRVEVCIFANAEGRQGFKILKM
jgi:hypothetical protein